jgi:pimeloyl-ACP methyl ester carboxylesterase
MPLFVSDGAPASTQASTPTHFRRPHRSLLATELARSVAEFHAFTSAVPYMRALPRGDGHTVLVLPGFTGDDRTTVALRWFLADRGYRPLPWRLGRNLGPTDRIIDGLDSLFDGFTAAGERVSIVGWSLGGIFARELGRSYPAAIRSVFTLGSPFRLAATDREQTNASDAYDAVSDLHSDRARNLVPEDVRPPMPVPTTNIFSRTDGVVPWQSCLDVHGDQCENIQVPGSHAGLGHNPVVLAVIADRLAQRDGTWRPYEATGCMSAVVRVVRVPSSTD